MLSLTERTDGNKTSDSDTASASSSGLGRKLLVFGGALAAGYLLWRYVDFEADIGLLRERTPSAERVREHTPTAMREFERIPIGTPGDGSDEQTDEDVSEVVDDAETAVDLTDELTDDDSSEEPDGS